MMTMTRSYSQLFLLPMSCPWLESSLLTRWLGIRRKPNNIRLALSPVVKSSTNGGTSCRTRSTAEPYPVIRKWNEMRCSRQNTRDKSRDWKSNLLFERLSLLPVLEQVCRRYRDDNRDISIPTPVHEAEHLDRIPSIWRELQQKEYEHKLKVSNFLICGKQWSYRFGCIRSRPAFLK